MIQNKILTLNWCFIVINDVKDITESSTTLRVNQFLNLLRLSYQLVQIVKSSNAHVHDFCRQYSFDVFILVEAEFLSSTFMIFSTNALSRRSYFSESISVKNCWEFVSALVGICEYNDDTRVNFLFSNYIVSVVELYEYFC